MTDPERALLDIANARPYSADEDGFTGTTAESPRDFAARLQAIARYALTHCAGERLGLRAQSVAARPLAEALPALREALEPFAEMYRKDDDTEKIADECPVTWYYDMYGTQGLTAGDIRRAARVFAALARAEGEPLRYAGPYMSAPPGLDDYVLVHKRYTDLAGLTPEAP